MAAHAPSLLAGFPEAYRDVVHFLARRTGNPDDARELAHDVWVRLAEREQGGAAPIPSDPRAFLFTIAQNIAIDHLRKRRLIREHAALAHPEEGLIPDTAESLMYRQVLAIVDATLQSLPERTREVFVLHRMHGAGQADLAVKFGVSRNTIERDVMTAMDAVQTALEAWHADTDRNSATAAGRKGRRKALAALFGALATATTGAAVWRWWNAALPQWQASLATPRGKLATYTLPDGSTVMLDADSRVTASFTGAARSLQLLRGAAYFAVAPDAEKPFSVRAESVSVVVTGTRFGVEIEPSGVSVQVESGRVRVEPDGLASLELGAGDSVQIEAGLAPRRWRADASAITSWRHGELVFEDARLGDAIARLDRYAAEGGSQVRVAADAAGLPVSGRVSIARAREWMAALPTALPVRVESVADGVVEIQRR